MNPRSASSPASGGGGPRRRRLARARGPHHRGRLRRLRPLPRDAHLAADRARLGDQPVPARRGEHGPHHRGARRRPAPRPPTPPRPLPPRADGRSGARSSSATWASPTRCAAAAPTAATRAAGYCATSRSPCPPAQRWASWAPWGAARARCWSWCRGCSTPRRAPCCSTASRSHSWTPTRSAARWLRPAGEPALQRVHRRQHPLRRARRRAGRRHRRLAEPGAERTAGRAGR
jgi:hypothetical protein